MQFSDETPQKRRPKSRSRRKSGDRIRGSPSARKHLLRDVPQISTTGNDSGSAAFQQRQHSYSLPQTNGMRNSRAERYSSNVTFSQVNKEVAPPGTQRTHTSTQHRVRDESDDDSTCVGADSDDDVINRQPRRSSSFRCRDQRSDDKSNSRFTQQSNGNQQQESERQHDTSEMVSLIEAVVREAMKQSPPASATTAASDGNGGRSSDFTQVSQQSRTRSSRSRQSPRTAGQHQSADGRGVDKANGGRAGDRNNNNGSDRPRRRASGGGGGGDSSSSDDEDSNRDGGGGRSSDFIRVARMSHSRHTRQSTTSAGQYSSAGGRDTGDAGNRRSSGRGNRNGPSRPHRQANGGGGGDDDSSSDGSDGSASGDGSGGGRRGRRSGARDDPDSSPVRTRHTSTSNHSRWMKCDRFDGSSCFETFMCQFENCAQYNGWSERDKRAHLRKALKKEAAQLLWHTDELSYDELVNKLKKRYSSKGMEEKFQSELRCLRRRRGESIRELAQEVRRLLSLAYPGEQSTMFEHCARDHFLTSLNDPELELKVRERDPPDMETAVRLAMRLEISKGMVYAAHGPPRQHAARQIAEEPVMTRAAEAPCAPDLEAVVTSAIERTLAKSQSPVPESATPKLDSTHQTDRQPGRRRDDAGRRSKKFSRAVGRDETPPERTAAVSTTAAETQRLKQQMDAMAAELARLKLQQNAPPAADPVQPSQRRTAYFYQRSDANGYNPNQSYGRAYPNAGPPAPASQGENAGSPRRCWVCDQPGHFARSCPQGAGTSQYQQQGSQVNGVTNCRAVGEHACYLKARINGTSCEALLDTGSEVSVLPLHLVKGCEIRPTIQTLRAANGTRIPVVGETTVRIVTPKMKSTVTGLVTEHVHEPMLGINFLYDKQAQWTFTQASLILAGQLHEQIVRPRACKWNRRVVLQEDVQVPPRSQTDLPCKVVLSGKEWSFCRALPPEAYSETCWGTRPTPLKYGVYAARTICAEGKFGDVPIRVMNVQRFPRSITAGTTVADLEALTLMSQGAQPDVAAGKSPSAIGSRPTQLTPRPAESVTGGYSGRFNRESNGHVVNGVYYRDATSRVRSTSTATVSTHRSIWIV